MTQHCVGDNQLCRESSGKLPLPVSHSPHLPNSGHSLGLALQAPPVFIVITQHQQHRRKPSRSAVPSLWRRAQALPTKRSAGDQMAETTVTNGKQQLGMEDLSWRQPVW
jgi:hypothetical protein